MLQTAEPKIDASQDAGRPQPPKTSRAPGHVALMVSITATVLLCSALLILPGATATTMYFNDVLIFLDGGYRVVAGQIPNHDFHTALGPLNFYLPGFGYWLSGTLGLAMPVGLTALMVGLAPLMLYVLGSRLRPALAVPLAIFLLMLLVTPMNTGEMPSKISFAMFYNRIGWVLVALLLVMHLSPIAPRRWHLEVDAIVAALLTLTAFYTKMTYGVVALGFLILMLLQPRGRGWAVGALVLCAVLGAAVEAVWGGTRAYIADLIEAAEVSGVTEWQIYVRSLMRVSGELAAFLCLAGLALWHRTRWTDFLFYGFCAAAGFALINQNFQIYGMITLLAGAAVAAEILCRQERAGALAKGAPIAVIVLLLPIGLASAAALGLHAVIAGTKVGIAVDTPNGQDLRVVNVLDRGHFEFYSNYSETLSTGADLLEQLDRPASRVLVMDFVSPLTSLAGLTPPDGGQAWMHDNRNFDTEVHLSGEDMLGGVDVVMVPKRPVAEGVTEKMLLIYSAYLEDHFDLALSTAHWSVYQRRLSPPAAEPWDGPHSS